AEVRHVGGHVAGLGVVGLALAASAATIAVRGAAAVAGAEELDGVGDDLHRLAFAAPVFGLPLTPVEPAFDRHRAAAGEIGRAVVALGAEDDHVEVVRLVDPLAALIFAAAVDGDAPLANGGAAAGAAQFRILREVAGDDHHVHVRSCQESSLLCIRCLTSSLGPSTARLSPLDGCESRKERGATRSEAGN